jgi:hypothetical protein
MTVSLEDFRVLDIQEVRVRPAAKLRVAKCEVRLDRAPSVGWFRCFLEPAEPHEMIPPDSFGLQRNSFQFSCTVAEVERYIRELKRYVELANELFQRREEAAREAEERREVDGAALEGEKQRLIEELEEKGRRLLESE